ncbi:tape measure protein [Pyramidobacter piscolens]|uniref:tape measure protein n=1 Tax=Pyramidobacter piscolens TaxID=638849 RepID=UPI003AB4E63F
MATIADLLVKISADSTQFRKELRAVQRNIRSFMGSEAFAMSRRMARGLAGITVAAGALGVKAIQMSGQMAVVNVAFEKLTGSADAAKKHLGDLNKFAAQTPFDVAGVRESSRLLHAFGVETKHVVPILRTLGDAAAATGKGDEGLVELSKIIGQISAKGTILKRDLDRITQQGINAARLIGDEMGMTSAQVYEATSKGALSAGDALDALLKGLSQKYAGLMDRISGEIPISFSNMQISLKSVLTSIGDDITESFDLKDVFAQCSAWLIDFADAVRTSGIRKALNDMIPDNVKAKIVGLSAAIATILLPTVGLLLIKVGLLITPFTALAAAVGLCATLIYEHWEEISEYIAKIVAWVDTGIDRIKEFFAQFDRSSEVRLMLETKESAYNEISEMIDEIEGRTKGKESAADTAKKSAGRDGLANPAANTEERYEKNLAAARAALRKSGGKGKGVGKGGKSYDDLLKEAKKVSDAIEDQWIDLIGTKIDALEKWHGEESAKLEASRRANENYERDKTRLEEVYAEKRRRILQEEAQEKREIYRHIADGYEDMQERISAGSLYGSALELSDMANEARRSYEEIASFFDSLGQDYATGTRNQKAGILAALEEVGMAYRLTEEDVLDLSAEKAAALTRAKQAEWDKQTEYFRQCKDLEADIQAAHDQSSLAMLQSALSEENAVRLNNLEAQKTMLDAWQEAQLAAHATTAQLMSDMYATAFDSMSGSISDLLMGTKSLSEAWKSFGQSVLQVVADYFAKKVAGMLMVAVAGKSVLATQTAASAAAGAATASAWVPAAAAVSLATMGGNSVPAMAGILATHALSSSLSIPGLAEGGLVTGPTLAQIGEGRYSEVVAPLNDKVFNKLAAGITSHGGGGAPVSVTVQAFDAKSLENWLDNKGGRALGKWLKSQRREFALIGGGA